MDVILLPIPVKGQSDPRKYQQFRLSNGIEVIIIHDPLSDTAGASLDVGVGSFSDPPDRPGLAHFLEHLLFMGTVKYPDEAEYQFFLTEHGGSSNAYTDDEHTNYFFDVAWEYLEGALDRFAQFFISPLFSESCTERERDAVNSEHEKNVSDDEWRFHQLVRHLSGSTQTRFNSFGTGNRETLAGEQIRQQIIEFYHRHYEPSSMRLVIFGRHSLEQLSGWAVDIFSPVKTKCQVDIENPCKNFCVGPRAPRLTLMHCIKPLRRLEFVWMVRGLRHEWASEPLDVISEWIGDERAGSLLSCLRAKSLATAMHVDVQEYSTFSLFRISIECSSGGISTWKHVVQLLFSWLKFLQNSLKVESLARWEELANIRKQEFDYTERQHASSIVHELAAVMRWYPPEERLRGHSDWLWERPSIELLYSLFEEDLAPAHCHILHLIGSSTSDSSGDSKDSIGPCEPRYYEFEDHPSGTDDEFSHEEASHQQQVDIPCWLTEIADEKEPWYGTFYRSTLLTAKQFEELNPKSLSLYEEFFLPSPNGFITCDFTIATDGIKMDNELPLLLTSSLWFKPDTKFRLPRGLIFLFFPFSRLGFSDKEKMKMMTGFESFSPFVLQIAIQQLWQAAMADQLEEEFYDATLAGLQHRIMKGTKSATGMLVQFSGFSQHLLVLLERIAARCRQKKPSWDCRRLGVHIERLLRHYSSESMEMAFKVASSTLTCFLTPSLPCADVMSGVMSYFQDRVEQLAALLQEVEVGPGVALVHGNWSKEQVLNTIGFIPGEYPEGGLHPTIREVPPGRTVVIIRRGLSGVCCCVHFYFQIGRIGTSDEALRDYGLALLVAQMMTEPFFDLLRTKEQLGYYVRAQARIDGNVHGIELVVQSTSSPSLLVERIQRFLDVEFMHILRSLSKEELARHGAALQHRLDERPTSLMEESMPYWAAIWRGDLCFDLGHQCSIRVAELCKDRSLILKFYKDHLVERHKVTTTLRRHVCTITLPLSVTTTKQQNNGNYSPEMLRSLFPSNAYIIEVSKDTLSQLHNDF